jgi:hypothetical protein
MEDRGRDDQLDAIITLLEAIAHKLMGDDDIAELRMNQNYEIE